MSFAKYIRKNKKNYPSSLKFSSEGWKKILSSNPTSSVEDHHLYLAGLIVGEAIQGLDRDYKSLMRPFPEFNILDSIALINCASARRNLDLEKDANGISSINEVFFDALQMLLKNQDEGILHPSDTLSDDKFESAIAILSKRIYFNLLWKRVRDFGWQILEVGNTLIFKAKNTENEYGRTVSVTRYMHLLYQNLLESDHQRRHGLYDNSELRNIECIVYPSSVRLVKGERRFSLDHPDFEHQTTIRNFIVQVPFYMASRINDPLSENNPLSLSMIFRGWILLVEICNSIIKNIAQLPNNDLIYVDKICSFTLEEFSELYDDCLGFDKEETHLLLKLFSSYPKNVKDIWITPILQFGDVFRIIPVAVSAGNAQRIVDEIWHQYIDRDGKIKGKLFEKDAAAWLNKEIDSNTLLSDIFVRAFPVGIKYKDIDNEEIDIVLRIGETYLIIEAKSFTFKTDNRGYLNVLEDFKDSDIQRKRKAFIQNFDRFKKNYDSSANFKLNPNKVFVCYLSSIPHVVGTTVNDAPVVDIHILERYFGLGYIGAQDRSKKEQGRYMLYHNTKQAEDGLWNYLRNPPQLDFYKENFSSLNNKTQFYFEGLEVESEEYYINIGPEAMEHFGEKMVSSENFEQID